LIVRGDVAGYQQTFDRRALFAWAFIFLLLGVASLAIVLF
jgi:hypothetical protein